ncbi:transcriptional regulator [Leucobacter sp. CSA2]|uniref:Transcriptional regulator n=1 Tax=Leucobacter edaphi TaxID=2796472 RepID=A0A934UW17_9MICO|nr:transcriptional regulator [Leucobacter edaphi]MBK0420500.1 transcriptional regulator [Leucobacter edaphi]
MTEWRALRRGESARERKVLLERAHERFLDDETLSRDPELRRDFATRSALREVVLDSWLRSRHRTVSPDAPPGGLALSDDELAELQRIHPIVRMLPVVNRLLLEEASESGFLVAIGDATGRLLWIDGDRRLRGKAEDIGFAVGTDWSEESVGTSAPGAALSLDHSIQVLGAEHYNRAVHHWSCTAAPVHDPLTGAIIGVIDVTGDDGAASPHILPLVEATLAAVEAELKLEALRGQIAGARSGGGAPSAATAEHRSPRIAAPRLLVLGRETAQLETDRGPLPVSGRHAEILLALAASPNGVNAAALADRVYGADASELTLRPELVRLRRWLAQSGTGLELRSRPYRLSGPLRSDATDVMEALGRGAHRVALAAYEGAALPTSLSPAAEDLRHEVDATLREAMLQSAAPEVLFEYANRWAADDAQVWETLLQTLPALSPKRARVVAKLEAIARVDDPAGPITH